MLWTSQVTEGVGLAMDIIEVRNRAIKRTAHPQQDAVLHAVFNGHRRCFLWPDRDVGIRARERYTVLYGYLICNSSRGEPPALLAGRACWLLFLPFATPAPLRKGEVSTAYLWLSTLFPLFVHCGM